MISLSLNTRVQLFKVGIGWDYALLKHKDGFEQTRHTAPRFEMSYIGLDGAYPEGI